MSDDDIDPKIAAEIKRHVRRARQIIREDRIIAGIGTTADNELPDDTEDDTPNDDGKPKSPKRKPPTPPEAPVHPWWGKAAP